MGIVIEFVEDFCGLDVYTIPTIFILGGKSVGKTTLFGYLKFGEFKEYEPTKHPNIEKIRFGKKRFRFVDGYSTKEILDGIGGWNWIGGIIYVVDSKNQDSIKQSEIELANIVKTKELNTCPILVLVNKYEKMNSIDESLISKKFIGKYWQRRGFNAYNVSIKEGTDMKHALKWFEKYCND